VHSQRCGFTAHHASAIFGKTDFRAFYLSFASFAA
jgi:hypothetical protein